MCWRDKDHIHILEMLKQHGVLQATSQEVNEVLVWLNKANIFFKQGNGPNTLRCNVLLTLYMTHEEQA